MIKAGYKTKYILKLLNANSTLCNECDKVADFARRRVCARAQRVASLHNVLFSIINHKRNHFLKHYNRNINAIIFSEYFTI